MSFAPVPDPKKYLNEKEYTKGYELIRLAVLLVIIFIPISILLAFFIHACFISIIPCVVILAYVLFILGFRKRY